MGLLDKAKEMLGMEGDHDATADENATEEERKSSGLAGKGDEVIDMAGDRVDKATGDRYTGQVDDAQEKAKDAMRKKMGW